MLIYGLRLKTSSEYRYVGLTITGTRRRLSNHISHTYSDKKRNYPVNDWIQKYGGSAIDIDVLQDLTGGTQDDLFAAEKAWIVLLREQGHRLLNLSEGGAGFGRPVAARNAMYGRRGADHPAFGRVHSAETLAKLSETKRGKNNPNFGVSMTQAEKDRRSKTLKGRPMPSSKRSAHTRHHTNKGVSKPETCNYCKNQEVIH